MSGCERFKDVIERCITGETTPSDLEALKEHSRSCADCRLALELHEDLEYAAAARGEMPSPCGAPRGPTPVSR